MKRFMKTPKAATALALLLCSQVLLVGCATTTDTASSPAEDDARLAKAEKMADRFESRPRLPNGR